MNAECMVDLATPWTAGKGELADVVLSSRIRLARNIKQLPFPLKQKDTQAQQVLDQVRDALDQKGGLSYHNMEKFSPIGRKVLVEKHLISPQHSTGNAHEKGLVLDGQGKVSIMINEEDHLRIQCFTSGLELEELWHIADGIDNMIEQQVDYAYDEKLGYLTCCPTNLGTGMRASVMMHLPAMVFTRRTGILTNLSSVGMTVRGLFGEGSEAEGGLFQISNQITLGQDERDVLINLQSVARRIVKEEKDARELLLQKNKLVVEDKVWRSLGILTHAKYLSSKEALALISDIRLGQVCGLIPHLTLEQINQLYLLCQPNYLQLLAGKELTEVERDVFRAEQIREQLQDKKGC